MRAGRLDRRIDIQRSVTTQNDIGEPIETWSDLASNRPASYRPLKGDERVSTPQAVATDQVEFTVRYSQLIMDLTPRDRIIYPSRLSDSPQSPIVETNVYDILSTSELGRKEGVQIIAERRPDLQ